MICFQETFSSKPILVLLICLGVGLPYWILQFFSNEFVIFSHIKRMVARSLDLPKMMNIYNYAEKMTL